MFNGGFSISGLVGIRLGLTLPQAERARFGEALARPLLRGRGAGDRGRPALPER